MPAFDGYKPIGMEVKSAVHKDTMEAYIFITDGEHQWRLTPEQGVAYGQALIQASCAALQDGLMVRFLKEEVGLTYDAIKHTIEKFHQWREERELAHEAEQQRRREEHRRIQEGN